MTFTLFKRMHKKISTMVIFDIGSGSVGAGVIRLEPKGKPKLLHVLRIPMCCGEELDFERFEHSMRVTLLDAALALQSRTATASIEIGKIDSIACVFSSPWYLSQIKLLKLNQQKSFIVTEEKLNDLLSKTVSSFLKNSNNERIVGEAELVEKNVITTKLNGYPTATPIGKRTRELEMALHLSMVGTEVVKHIKEVTSKVFHQDEPILHSLALVSFSVLRDMFPHEDEFLIVDVGCEVTDVSIVKKGVLSQTASFPEGINSAARRISKKLKTSVTDAHTRLHTAGKEKSALRDKTALIEAREKWKGNFEQTLQKLSEGGVLPQLVFLSAPRYLSLSYKQAIEESIFTEQIFAKEKFQVAVLDTKRLSEVILVDKNSDIDPYLALESLFFNKMANNSLVVS